MQATAIDSPSTRIIPVSKGNQIKRVTKTEDGGLRVEQNNGRIFKIKKEDALFQEFAIWTILNSGF